MARLTAERSQLLEELKKTECERERVGALQAAGAEEAEHLAAQQQRELQEAIVQEKEALAALERWVKCDCHRYNVRIYVHMYVRTCADWMIMYVRTYLLCILHAMLQMY